MTVLNEADAIYLGDTAADAVYLGAELIWPEELPAWTPADIANLSAWFDADDPTVFTYSSGSVVSQWRDKSPRALHLTSPAGAKPSRTGSRAGKPTVVFDGTRYMIHDGTTGINVGNLTVFSVFAESSHQIGNSSLLSLFTPGGDDWNSQFGIAVEMGPPGKVYTTARMGGIAAIDGSPMTQWSIYRTVCNAGGPVDVYANGVHGGGAVVPTTWGVANGGMTVGARYFSGALQSSYRLAGDIGEIIIYDRVLTDPETLEVENYLRSKWGVIQQDWLRQINQGESYVVPDPG